MSWDVCAGQESWEKEESKNFVDGYFRTTIQEQKDWTAQSKVGFK